LYLVFNSFLKEGGKEKKRRSFKDFPLLARRKEKKKEKGKRGRRKEDRRWRLAISLTKQLNYY